MMKEILEECIDELCCQCGKYENEYQGSCDDCKWYQIKSNNYSLDKKNKFSMMELAEEMKFFCESGDGCEDCPVYFEGYCEIGSPCEWILREV